MQLTPEQESDIKERTESFMKEYEALSEKYQIDWASKPILIPIGPGMYGITMYAGTQDKKYLPTPSPVDVTANN